MTRAAVYVRMSKDREGAGLGVERQEADCRELADRLGWQVGEVYVDNDLSAYSGKPRPRYRALLDDVRAGTVDAVVAWHNDRLHRSTLELVEYIEACRHVPTHFVRAGPLDLTHASGRMTATIVGAVAQQEVEHMVERMCRARQQVAEAGGTHGAHRGYGYQFVGSGRDRSRVVDEAEAKVIRECAARVLAGETTTSIYRDLNHRGIPSPAGRKWSPRGLVTVLVSARISGRREHIPASSHIGRIRPLIGEFTVQANWPAIISPEDSDRLRRLLTNPARNTRPLGAGRKYLLSGILICGGCGGKMICQTYTDRPDTYRCAGYQTQRGGGHVSITQGRTDEHIQELVFAALDSPATGERLRHREAPPDNLHAQIRADEDELERLAAEFGNGEISRAVWKAASAPIEARREANSRKLATRSQTNALETFVGTEEEMRDRWNIANLSQRRAVVSAVFEKITVRPNAVPGRSTFDHDRFEPIVRRG